MATPVATTGRPFAPNSIIWEKKGPLPVWAWALLVLLLALGWSVWRRNRTEGEAANVVTGSDEPLPGDQSGPPVFIVPPATPPAINVPITVQPAPVTVPAAPPGGGSAPPSTGPITKPPTPKPAPPKGGYVTTTTYPDRTAPKESTLWDIAYTWLPQGASQWGMIWNHPLNKDLKKKRGAPEKIRPGDRWFVPNKLSKART